MPLFTKAFTFYKQFYSLKVDGVLPQSFLIMKRKKCAKHHSCYTAFETHAAFCIMSCLTFKLDFLKAGCAIVKVL